MAFRIPFTFSSTDKLKKRSAWLSSFLPRKQRSKLTDHLVNMDIPLTREEYLSIVMRSCILMFTTTIVIATAILFIMNVSRFILYGLSLAILFTLFIASSQMIYPKVYASRKQRVIEKNLIPALEDMLVQLNSGIPLFNIMVNLSSASYGELSNEFRKAVKKINAGLPETDVLDEIGRKNSSLYFRRTLWQISNGMKAGSDISIVVKDSIKSLNEEQLLQIQTYGSKLNPLVMFYMLISVILPALSVTFLTVISSMVNLSATVTMGLFGAVFFFVVIIQVSFLGMMKSIRPSLL